MALARRIGESDAEPAHRIDRAAGEVGERPGREGAKADAEQVERARGRPPSPAAKKQVTIRLEPELLERLRATGPGWQTRIGEAVREWLAKRAA